MLFNLWIFIIFIIFLLGKQIPVKDILHLTCSQMDKKEEPFDSVSPPGEYTTSWTGEHSFRSDGKCCVSTCSQKPLAALSLLFQLPSRGRSRSSSMVAMPGRVPRCWWQIFGSTVPDKQETSRFRTGKWRGKSFLQANSHSVSQKRYIRQGIYTFRICFQEQMEKKCSLRIKNYLEKEKNRQAVVKESLRKVIY